MKKKIKDSRLLWEATKTCGMYMAMQYYCVNVMFNHEAWEYILLTQKYMKDIIMFDTMRNNKKGE